MRKSLFAASAAYLLAGVCFAAEGAGSGGDPSPDNAGIKAALGKLDTTVDTDWTQGGLPSMDRMKELTGNNDLTRSQVSAAHSGFNRENTSLEAKPAEEQGQDKPTGDDTAARDQQDAKDKQEGDRHEDAINDPGNKEYEQAKLAEEEGEPIKAYDTDDAPSLAERVKDPIVLIEAALLAAQADRFRRNGALSTFLRHYMVDQSSIKDFQKRLDARTEDREERMKSAAT